MAVFDTQEVSSAEILEKKLRVFSALADMNSLIHTATNINQLLKILVEKAVVGVDFERFLLYLLDEEGGYLRCVAWIDRIKKEKASILEKRVGFRMEETAVETLAVKTGNTVYVEDARKDRRVSRKLLRVTDIRSYCVAPLMGRDRVLGVLTGDKHYSKSPIVPEDLETLQLFSGHISLAIENAMLYEEKDRFNKLLEKRVEERTFELASANQELSTRMNKLNTLYEMSRLLNERLEQRAILDQLLSLVAHLGHRICSIRLSREGRLFLTAQKGLDKEYEKLANLPLTEGSFDHLLGGESPLVIQDLDKHPVAVPLQSYFKKKGIRSCVVVPMVARGVVIGMMRVYSKARNGFPEEQREFFSAFGHQAAMALENAEKFQRIEQENVYLKEKTKSKLVVGRSLDMERVMELVRGVAPTSTTVIIYGETGTGKELIANAIHEMSTRSAKPLIKVNCAAIPEELMESELFGHERGAFTSAFEKRIGMFELANGGTVFLDEIGDLSLRTQTKLLRVLQEQEIQRIGSKAPLRVDVRVVAATNCDLREKMEQKGFRPDLFYRLSVFPISLPPLRDRKEDIAELVDFFLTKYAYLKKKKVAVSEEVVRMFQSYSWPGNIRELENIIERSVIISKNNLITKDDLPLWRDSTAPAPNKTLGVAVREFKKEMILQTLARTGGKKSKAAEMLGLPRSNFSRLLKTMNIH